MSELPKANSPAPNQPEEHPDGISFNVSTWISWKRNIKPSASLSEDLNGLCSTEVIPRESVKSWVENAIVHKVKLKLNFQQCGINAS